MKKGKITVLFFTTVVFITGCSLSEQKNPSEDNAIVIEETITGNEPPSQNESDKNADNTASGNDATNQEEAITYNYYNVSLEIEPSTRFVEGVEKVFFKNPAKKDIQEIYFNIPVLAYSENIPYKPYFDEFERRIFKYGMDYSQFEIENILVNGAQAQFELSNTVLCVYLPELLPVNGTSEITIQFSSYIPKIAQRTGANNQAMWFGNFLPTLAVYNEKGFHTPQYYPAGDPFFTETSNYDVTITTPSDYTVVSTGIENVSNKGDYVVTTIQTNMVRDFAFAISNAYQVHSTISKDGVYVNFYYYSDTVPNKERLVSMAVSALEYLSETIGPYPYSSLDIIECKLYGDIQMEYPQIIFVDENYIRRESAIQSMAHEVTHQWFYNLIGSDPVHNAWLDEGMTMYMQLGVYLSKEEIDSLMQTNYANLKDSYPYLLHTSLQDDLSVYRSWNEYYQIQYTKGKLMVYSLHKKMGDEKFDEFLKQYYKQYLYKIVDTEKFIQLAEEIYGNNLTDFFESWLGEGELPPLQ